ncbi:CBS domain-containing protein [Haladaptatus sp. F3-133]|jgi:predicted transcriptional regulator|uniref:CBS domain-containing protein n=1 Tax=Halorutilus salinus TaxID=2487751 RepID=A0A9Q4C3L8_9EURY|nr:CBS domain-containing protein [Halorutilus salinus]MCX2818350.1 CBS domain-containing protein [Halorutilus salinus]
MEIPTPEDLKEKRKSLGMTQSELADSAGVSQPLIARIENGDVDPRLSTVSRIVEVFETAEEDVVTADDLMSDGVISVAPDDTVRDAVETMQDAQFSQLPVVKDGVPVGSTSDATVARARSQTEDLPHAPVEDIMGESFPTISPDADLSTVSRLLDHSSAVLVTREGKVAGIITDADLAAYVGSD